VLRAIEDGTLPTTGHYRIDELDSIAAQVDATNAPPATTNWPRRALIASFAGFTLVTLRRTGRI
jgi:hypothetical protein